MSTIKTRFAPSPTGHLHVGGARTALFSFAMARQKGGTFLLRIEDTDRERHQEDAIPKIIDDLRWLGIEWDEGIDLDAAGKIVHRGPNGPYRQSDRLGLYTQHIRRLLDEGKAYYAFETAEELEAQRLAAQEAKRTYIYPRPGSFPSDADAEKARSEGRPVVVRFATPEGDVTITDDAFGDVTMPADQMEDFILQKADGWPTYHLANVVDDALMGVTYIMRGQEFLGQTWRHVLLRAAFGYPEPGYCHLPLILDMQGRKLSKRDGDVEVHSFRAAGYLPEALINFIALLGWRPGANEEKFALSEFIELFSANRVGKANAKFDRDKLLAFNTDAFAAADEPRRLAALQDYLALNETAIPPGDDELLRLLLRANPTARTLADIPAKADVLFGPDDAFPYDPKAVAKVLTKNDNQGLTVLAELAKALAETDWAFESVERVLNDVSERDGLGMGKVAQPLRVALTGSTVSPPIVDTLLLTGKPKTLARIARCLRECA